MLDLNVLDRDGFSVLAEVRERYPAISVVVLSGQQDRSNVAKALELELAWKISPQILVQTSANTAPGNAGGARAD